MKKLACKIWAGRQIHKIPRSVLHPKAKTFNHSYECQTNKNKAFEVGEHLASQEVNNWSQLLSFSAAKNNNLNKRWPSNQMFSSYFNTCIGHEFWGNTNAWVCWEGAPQFLPVWSSTNFQPTLWPCFFLGYVFFVNIVRLKQSRVYSLHPQTVDMIYSILAYLSYL